MPPTRLSPTALEILSVLLRHEGMWLTFDQIRAERRSNGASTTMIVAALNRLCLIEPDREITSWPDYDVRWAITGAGRDAYMDCREDRA